MEHISGHNGREREISELFTAVFAASEGAEEARIIGGLVDRLMETTPAEDMFVFSAYDGQVLVGCIFLSRLIYDTDDRIVFILSPVAVRTDRQKQGIGQKLITFGLDALRRKKADIAVTYGDPDYYSRVGFRQITEAQAKAPHRLNQPHGWLGQSLSGKDWAPLSGQSRCVEALNRAELW